MKPAAALAIASALYSLITVLLFSNLLPVISTHVPSDVGDPILNSAVLAWNAQHVPLTADWWNFPSFAPVSGTTAFTEHLLLAYPLTTPIIWLTHNPLLAHNTLLLLSFPLNAIAAYALTRTLTGSAAAAFVGGLAFGFAPFQAVQLSHVQMLLDFGIPTMLLGLHLFIAGTRGGALLVAAGWLMTALSSAYMLVFCPILIALWIGWFVRPAEWRRLLPIVALFAAVSGAIAPLLFGYRLRQVAYGFFRPYGEIKTFSADIAGIAGASFRSTLWAHVLPTDFGEGSLFPGITIVMLAAIAVMSSIRSARRSGGSSYSPRRTLRDDVMSRVCWAGIISFGLGLARVHAGFFGWHFGPLPLPPIEPFRLFTLSAVLLAISLVLSRTFVTLWTRRDPTAFYGVAALILWMISWGPEPTWLGSRALAYGPYRILLGVPGFQSVRVPARAWIPASLCLAVLAAYGASVLARHVPRRASLTIGIVAFVMLAEGWFTGPAVKAPALVAGRVIPSGALVLDFPIGVAAWDVEAEYHAVLEGYRSINGYSGYEPTHYGTVRSMTSERIDRLLVVYRQFDDVWVVNRNDDTGFREWIEAQPGAELRAHTPAGEFYRLPRLGPIRTRLPLPLPSRYLPPFAIE